MSVPQSKPLINDLFSTPENSPGKLSKESANATIDNSALATPSSEPPPMDHLGFSTGMTPPEATVSTTLLPTFELNGDVASPTAVIPVTTPVKDQITRTNSSSRMGTLTQTFRAGNSKTVYNEKDREHRALKEKVVALEKESNELELRIGKLEMEIRALETQLQETTEELHEVKAECASVYCQILLF
jgi:hypothetical protein